jgi:hypothetical protein
MVNRLGIVAGAAVGYVLGARAGRRRYEQISALAGKALASPPAQKAKGVARDQMGQLTEQAKGKATGLASDARSSVGVRVSSAVSGGKARVSGQRTGSQQGAQSNGTGDLPPTGESGEQGFAGRPGSGYSI